MTATHRTETRQAAGATRERLLDAAERLFAQRGLGATSVRAITAAAGANLAAVSYHFGGKHRLYVESFRRQFAALRERRIAAVRATLGGSAGRVRLETLLAAFAEAFLAPLLDAEGGRGVLRMIQREMLDPQLPDGMFEGELSGPVRDALAKGILAVEPGLPSVHVARSTESFVAQLLHLACRLDRAAGADARAGMRAHIEHIVRFSAAGIRAPRPRSGSGPRTRKDPV